MREGIFGLLAIVFLFVGIATAGPVEVSGGLDITGMPGTDGITFPDGTSQTSAVIGGQYQKRITATCSTGYAMRAIDSTGGVATCEPSGVNGILGTDKGGTGISAAPKTSGLYLRSSKEGLWDVGGIELTDLPSLSSGYVDLSTDQSIGGNKSFTGTISSAGAISGPNVTSGTDPGHTHTGAGGGVPSGFMVLGETTTPPAGYTYTGDYVVGTGIWTTKSAMPTAREAHAVVTVNNKVYAIGGYNSISGFLTTNEEYDPVANTWATRTAMPTARRYLAAAVVNNKVYAIGGGYNSINGFLTTNEEYDPVANTWATRTAMPTARRYLAAAVVNNKVYAIGGYNAGYLNTNEEYDPVANTWATKTPMPTARGYLAVVAVNKVYAIGGTPDGLNSLSANEEYDPVANTWATKTPMPTARYFFSAAAVNSKVYAIGGFDGFSLLNTNEEYDPVTNTWTTKSAMPTAREAHAVVAVNNKVYAIGGYNAGYLNTNEEYAPGHYYVHRKN